jgi:hypothetical protein
MTNENKVDTMSMQISTGNLQSVSGINITITNDSINNPSELIKIALKIFNIDEKEYQGVQEHGWNAKFREILLARVSKLSSKAAGPKAVQYINLYNLIKRNVMGDINVKLT